MEEDKLDEKIKMGETILQRMTRRRRNREMVNELVARVLTKPEEVEKAEKNECVFPKPIPKKLKNKKSLHKQNKEYVIVEEEKKSDHFGSTPSPIICAMELAGLTGDDGDKVDACEPSAPAAENPSRRPAICRCGKPTYLQGGGLRWWGLSALCLDENCSSPSKEETESVYAARYCSQKAQSETSNTTRDTRKVPFAERVVEEVPIAADDNSMRIDPADGQLYTKNTILKYYKRCWRRQQIENYWKNMSSLQ